MKNIIFKTLLHSINEKKIELHNEWRLVKITVEIRSFKTERRKVASYVDENTQKKFYETGNTSIST